MYDFIINKWKLIIYEVYVCIYVSGGQSWVRELWRDVDAAMATRRRRSLPLQRVRSLLQDERTQSTARQTQEETGEWSCQF